MSTLSNWVVFDKPQQKAMVNRQKWRFQMSAKVIPAMTAAILLAGAAVASAVAPAKNSGDMHNFYAGHNNDASAMHNVYAGHNNQHQAAATPNHSLQKQRPVFSGGRTSHQKSPPS